MNTPCVCSMHRGTWSEIQHRCADLLAAASCGVVASWAQTCQALPVYLVHFEFDPEMPELLNLPLCDSCGLQAAMAT